MEIPRAAYSATELPQSEEDASFAKSQGTCDNPGPDFTKPGFDPLVPCSTYDVTLVSDPKLVENQVGLGLSFRPAGLPRDLSSAGVSRLFQTG